MSSESLAAFLSDQKHGVVSRKIIQSVIFVLGDLTALGLATILALFCTLESDAPFISIFSLPNPHKYSVFYAVMLAAWLAWSGLVKRFYTSRKPFWAELWQLFMAVLAFVVASAAFSGFIGADRYPLGLAGAWLSLIVLLPMTRQLSRLLLRRWKLWCIPTVIIGNGENAREAYLALQSEPSLGFAVHAFVALLAKNDRRVNVRLTSPVEHIPLVSMGWSDKEVKQLQGFQCVIAFDTADDKLRDAVIRRLNHNRITNVHVIPSMRGVPLYGMETFNFFSHEVLLIQLRNNTSYLVHRASKRAFDFIGALLLLLLLSPLLAGLAYMVAKDGGPPFFGHVRVGRNGKPFKCYKFRSMVVNAQEILAHLLATDPAAKAEWDKDFKLKNDSRVSKLGEMMRSTSLDELPQLWNVLKGDMSLVGPRPIVQAELERYGDDADYYLMARPGITGLWQVSGRNDVEYATRVYLDAWYVKNWSLWTDVAILVKTIDAVFLRRGAY